MTEPIELSPELKLVLAKLAEHGYELATEPTETLTQLRLTGRVHKPRIPTWMLTIETLCVASIGAPWTIDISQHHFVQKPMADLIASGAEPLNGSHVRFGWRIIMQAANGIRLQYGALLQVLGRVQPPRTEIMQVTLKAPPDRNSLVRGKGVRPLSSNGVSSPTR